MAPKKKLKLTGTRTRRLPIPTDCPLPTTESTLITAGPISITWGGEIVHEHSTTAEMEAQIASTQSETCTVAVVEQSVEIELDIEGLPGSTVDSVYSYLSGVAEYASVQGGSIVQDNEIRTDADFAVVNVDILQGAANHTSEATVGATVSPASAPLHAFQQHMNDFKWARCENCFERFPDLKVDIFGRCSVCSRDPLLLSRLNNMDPGRVPIIFITLTMIEQLLIARIHTVVSVFRLKSGQLAYSGNVINFPQDVASFAQTLPHSIADLRGIVVIRRETAEEGVFREFHVRANRIKTALRYLKENNAFYADIVISELNLSKLPEDGNVYQQLQHLPPASSNNAAQPADDEITEVTYGNAPGAQATQQDERIHAALQPDNIAWPNINSSPINEFQTEGYIVCALSVQKEVVFENEIKISAGRRERVYRSGIQRAALGARLAASQLSSSSSPSSSQESCVSPGSSASQASFSSEESFPSFCFGSLPGNLE